MNNEKTWEALNLRILHIGINADGDEDAHRLAGQFETLFGFTPNENDLSIFSSPLIEIMKNDGPGEKGHIAIGCDNLEEAYACLNARGLHRDEALTAKYDPVGANRVIYFEEQIGGFAFHLKEYPKK